MGHVSIAAHALSSQVGSFLGYGIRLSVVQGSTDHLHTLLLLWCNLPSGIALAGLRPRCVHGRALLKGPLLRLPSLAPALIAALRVARHVRLRRRALLEVLGHLHEHGTALLSGKPMYYNVTIVVAISLWCCPALQLSSGAPRISSFAHVRVPSRQYFKQVSQVVP